MIGTDEEKTQIYNQVMQKGLRKFDRKIENLHQEIMNIESNNTMLGSKDRNKYWELHDKGRKRTKKDYEQFDRLKRKA